MPKQKYVAIFHANLNYAFLTPDKYERTIRASYETIIDGFARHPHQKFVFEASGFTIDVMARETPDVLQKLKAAIDEGRCEFMGAPYAHPIMANIPEEDGYWSVEFAQRSFERHLGARAESFWNPECTWMQHVPRCFRRAGAKYLTLDYESYMTCNDKDYAWVERNRTHDMNWGGHLPWYPIDPDNKFLHRPFRDIVPGLSGMCRSDRIIGKYVGYFLGRVPLQEFIDTIKEWSGSPDNGASIIIADDAEYCGTTGYFFVKYFRDYDKSFLVDEEASDKLDKLLQALDGFGELITFKEACETIDPVDEPFYVEDRFAWHRTYADAWAGTPEARAWDPLLAQVRQDYKDNVQPIVEDPAHPRHEEFKPLYEEFWYRMTNSANSDGRWPPPPAETCPFNREWVLEEFEKTKAALVALKEAIAGEQLPPPAGPKEPDPDAESGYDYPFTEKDVHDIPRLNNYEIQHAIYYYNDMIDNAGEDQEKMAFAKQKMVEIFDELDRRGMQGIRHPAIRD
ncbi:MAG: hypothetical protein ACOCXA_04375 [Planctomycetota bacterium]